tara:strand:- start:267 stop:386 length:120 start_codon:yes stop_codon:yes gene_type:complete
MDGFDELSDWLEKNVFFADEEDGDSEDKNKEGKNDVDYH